MSGKSYETARLSDLERPNGWAPIRLRLGVQAFGINSWTAGEGERLIPEHDEAPSGHEELYIVVSGRASFTVGGDTVDAPAGTVLFVRDPAATREAHAAEAGTTVLVVGGRPGEAYRPRSWETNAEALPLFEEGRYEELRTLLLDALDRYEDRGSLLYNLACAEAQLGETDAALEHLTEALIEEPRLSGNAREDSDLDPIRGDPRFPI